MSFLGSLLGTDDYKYNEEADKAPETTAKKEEAEKPAPKPEKKAPEAESTETPVVRREAAKPTPKPEEAKKEAAPKPVAPAPVPVTEASTKTTSSDTAVKKSAPVTTTPPVAPVTTSAPAPAPAPVKIVPAASDSAKKVIRREMKSRSFYNGIGDSAYEFDRTGILDPGLKEWVITLFADNEDLRAAVMARLPEFLVSNPDLVSSTIATAKTAADKALVPFRVVFIHKATKTEYQGRAEAEAAIADLRPLGVTFSSAYDVAYRHVNADGSLGERVKTAAEIQAYIDSFPGDKAALIRKLEWK